MHIKTVEIEFDPAKSATNEIRRGLPFSLVAGFDWDSAVVLPDTRKAYAEPRFLALSMIGRRLHAVVFTPTVAGVRVISFRKANRREGRKHDQAKS